MRMKRSYFRSIIRSYTIAVSIPVMILCILLYCVGVEEVIQVKQNGRRDLLASIALQLDQRLEESDDMALLMSMEDELIQISPNQGIVKDMEVISRLKSYVNTNSFFDEIIIFRSDAPFLYTSAGTVCMQVLLTREYSFSEEERAIFEQMLYSDNGGIQYFTSADVILRFVPFPVFGHGKIGSAIYVLKKTTIEKTMALPPLDRGAIMALVDSYGKPIYVQNHEWGNMDVAAIIEARYLNRFVRIDGRKYMLVVEKIDSTEWKLIWLRPIQSFYQDTSLGILIIAMIAIFLISGCLIAGLSKKQYAPIKRISFITSNKTSDDLDNIEQAIRDHQNLSHQVEKQRLMLRDNLLMRLLNGELIAEGELLKICQTLDVFTNCDTVWVVSIRCSETLSKGVMEELLAFIEARYSKNGDAYAVNASQDQSMLMVCPIDGVNRLSNMLFDVEEMIGKLTGGTSRYGISTPHSISKLAAAQLEAHTALEYTKSPPENINFYDSIFVAPQLNRDYLKIEHQLAGSLRRGDEQAALDSLEMLLQSDQNRKSARQIQRYYQFRIAETIVRVVTDDTITRTLRESDYEQLSPLLISTLTYCSYEEFDQYAHQIVLKVCQMMQNVIKVQQEQISHQVLNWVGEHIYDSALSLNMLCDTMGFSSAYWSQFFRERLAISFNDYVWSLRLQRCKDMLIHTEMPVKDIVLKIGYIDASSFIRRFRQVEGCTPGQYRAQHMKEGF